MARSKPASVPSRKTRHHRKSICELPPESGLVEFLNRVQRELNSIGEPGNSRQQVIVRTAKLGIARFLQRLRDRGIESTDEQVNWLLCVAFDVGCAYQEYYDWKRFQRLIDNTSHGYFSGSDWESTAEIDVAQLLRAKGRMLAHEKRRDEAHSRAIHVRERVSELRAKGLLKMAAVEQTALEFDISEKTVLRDLKRGLDKW